jgi:predicted Zn-dependent peptidase
VELLSDIFLNSTFPEVELKRESRVINEEINMVEDTPEDYIHDIFSRSLWGDRGLGQTVLGRKETIKRITRNDLLAHIRRFYGTKDTIVSCAGNFKGNAIKEMMERSLGRLRRGSKPIAGETPSFRAMTKVYDRDLSEVHLCLGIQGIRQSSPDRYCLLILNTVLGGGISSRLFQEIREKRGLAYSVYSFLSSYLDTGFWAVYAGTGKRNVNEVIERALKELSKLHESITEDEIQRAKDQLKGSIMLGLESTSRRMQNIANQEIYYGRYHSPVEVMRKIDSVSIRKARQTAERLIKGSGVALTMLGPVKKNSKQMVLPEL